MSPLAPTLAAGTVLGIILYRGAVFGGVSSVELLVPGYVDWFMPFPIADAWIVVCIVTSLLVQWHDPLLSALSLSAAGSGLVFLGLYAFAYGFRTGSLLHLTMAEVAEIAVEIYCLSVGGLVLYESYNAPKRLLRSVPSAEARRREASQTMDWLYLSIAIASEVVATSAPKASDGFTRLVPSLVVIAGYGSAFFFRSLTLRATRGGVVYAVWSGVGIVLVSLIGWMIYQQALGAYAFVGIGFIVVGVALRDPCLNAPH